MKGLSHDRNFLITIILTIWS